MSDENFDPLANFPGMSNTNHKENQKKEKLEGSINDKDNSGRTGGTGGAGGTGGPGQADDPTTVDVGAPNGGKNDGGAVPLQPEYFAPDELGEDPMAYQYKHIVGSTGAMGGKGDAPKITKLGPGQIVSSKDMEEAAAEFERKIKTLSEKETLEQLYRQNTIAKDVISTAQRKMLSVAWAQGAIFKQMRNHILTRNGNWGEEIDLILKEIEMSRGPWTSTSTSTRRRVFLSTPTSVSTRRKMSFRPWPRFDTCWIRRTPSPTSLRSMGLTWITPRPTNGN
ncbi:hypothetical protein [Solidesulfovibrio fructosivorans]|uniref:hypothetical protein n=1 Tax=Solidesulfovibrio fructosivorans TaxID=878 RepID=UPI00118030EC|nr:hypothetical protein [Solidesulfovibrio fructosivorans]